MLGKRIYQLLQFWGNCFKWAYWRWEGRELMIRSALSILASIGGVIGAFIAKEWWISLIPLSILIIFIAPYKLWKSAHDDLIKLTEKRLKVDIEPQTGDSKKGAIWRQLRVTNVGVQPIDGCYGLLMEFKSEDKQKQNICPPPGFYYPWSSYGGRGKESKIAGNNGFDKLDIAVFNYLDAQYKDKLWTPELSADGYNRTTMYPLTAGTYYAKIQVGSKSTAFQPTEIILKLIYSGGANLQIEQQ
jgi:hypothetical protein